MNLQELKRLLAKAREYSRNGASENAARCFRRALRSAPDDPDLLLTVADAERRCDRYDTAEGLLRRAVDIRPGFFAAWCNLGASLRELGRNEEATAMFEKALSLQPDSAEARYNAAMAYLDCSQYAKAAELLEKAAELQPEMSGLHARLAHVYMKQSRFSDAKKVLSETLLRHPGSAEILNGLGNCAMKQRDLAAAKEYYIRALRCRPDFAEAHYNLGNIMREWNHPDEAVVSYRHALRFQPNRTAVLVNLGETLQLLGKTAESEACFRKALDIDPDCSIAGHNLLVSINYNPGHTAEAVIAAHVEWGKRQPPPGPPGKLKNDRNPERPLRIGYISPDFCNHPAASFLEPLLQHHNREHFIVHCYAQTVHEDEQTERFRSLASSWRPIERLSDGEAVQLIRNDRIDILIDTAGHLNGNRCGVLAEKAAPVQISGIGYPGPLGLPSVDYRITDAIIDPEKEPAVYPEKPLRLDRGFCCYRPPGHLPPVAPLPALSNGYLTFASLHTTARLNEQVIDLWCRVLTALPSSRLVIFRTSLAASVQQRLSGWFADRKISRNRIDFMSEVPSEGYLPVYDGIDLSLDTFPWSGHTTACEALMMGVPTITLRGDRPAGRMVESVLRSAGLSGFAAVTEEQFIGIARKYAESVEELSKLRSGLRKQVCASPLCSGAEYTAEIERRFQSIWHEWCTRN